MFRQPVDGGEAHEVPGDRALAHEQERRRLAEPEVGEGAPHRAVEHAVRLVLPRRHAEPDGPNRARRGRNAVDRLRRRTIRGDRHARENGREHRRGDREPERGDQRPAPAAADASPGEPDDVPGGAHAVAFRRRYAVVLARFPQTDIEHQLDEQFRDASKKSQPQPSFRHAFIRRQEPDAWAPTTTAAIAASARDAPSPAGDRTTVESAPSSGRSATSASAASKRARSGSSGASPVVLSSASVRRTARSSRAATKVRRRRPPPARAARGPRARSRAAPASRARRARSRESPC